ncbi:Transmembrane protein 136 [Eumeta japonica]|uniref:Transmembrane protein 136 n=1 Tax=Eumeta variegata TaxID=151549 RepID=A0A4C1S8F1_EUMVA|nr:Transmembrane protein 136 [Eumeta japonica]
MVEYSFDGVIGTSILDPVSLAAKCGSFAVWGCLYKWCLRMYPHRSPEWATRVLTLLHGLLATVVGFSQCDPSCLSSERLSTKCMPHHYALMLWSWGYFAFDFLWCSVYWRDNVLMLSHHGAALMSITLYMRRQYTGCAFACCLTLLEASNPLLQLRW